MRPENNYYFVEGPNVVVFLVSRCNEDGSGCGLSGWRHQYADFQISANLPLATSVQDPQLESESWGKIRSLYR